MLRKMYISVALAALLFVWFPGVLVAVPSMQSELVCWTASTSQDGEYRYSDFRGDAASLADYDVTIEDFGALSTLHKGTGTFEDWTYRITYTGGDFVRVYTAYGAGLFNSIYAADSGELQTIPATVNNMYALNGVADSSFTMMLCVPDDLVPTNTPTTDPPTPTDLPTNTPTATSGITPTPPPPPDNCEDYLINGASNVQLGANEFVSDVLGDLAVFSPLLGIFSLPDWPAQTLWTTIAPVGQYTVYGFGVLRICNSALFATVTPTQSVTPLPTASGTPIRTLTPTLTPTPTRTTTPTRTPTTTTTPTNTPTSIPTPTIPPECEVGPVDGLDCEQVALAQTQISLQRTQIALSGAQPTTDWGGVSTPLPGDNAPGANMATVQAIICEKEPCHSVTVVGGSVIGFFGSLMEYSNAPECSAVSFGNIGNDFIPMDGSYMSAGFCWAIDMLGPIIDVLRILSVAFVAFFVWRYLRSTMRRLGDV